jgi:predicted phosphodiesterase
MKIQYISDIHLEHRKDYFIKPMAPNLALCGDIGYPLKENYHYFIDRCSKDFKNVFVIFGNHEYYTNSIKRITMDEVVESINFPQNVYFLDNKCVYINILNNNVVIEKPLGTSDYIKIIGSTLWSNVNPDIHKYINDYKKIWVDKDRKFNYKDTIALYNQSVEYILSELSNDLEIKTILLTHHGSHSICNGKYQNKVNKQGIDLSSAYTSNIDKLYTFKNLLVCISGHTHSSINKYLYINDTSPPTELGNGQTNRKLLFLSNQVGYRCEDRNILNYNPRAVWEYIN